jgi:hypothetical protein
MILMSQLSIFLRKTTKATNRQWCVIEMRFPKRRNNRANIAAYKGRKLCAFSDMPVLLAANSIRCAQAAGVSLKNRGFDVSTSPHTAGAMPCK